MTDDQIENMLEDIIKELDHDIYLELYYYPREHPEIAFGCIENAKEVIDKLKEIVYRYLEIN